MGTALLFTSNWTWASDFASWSEFFHLEKREQNISPVYLDGLLRAGSRVVINGRWVR